MWFRRALRRISFATRRPKFREIKWNDDGEVRPVTRGKAKQFNGFEDQPRTPIKKSAAAYRIQSNLSCSSQAPLTAMAETHFELGRTAKAKPRHYTSRLK